MIPGYAELRCVSDFTFLRSASQPEELAAHATQLCYSALAVAAECPTAITRQSRASASERFRPVEQEARHRFEGHATCRGAQCVQQELDAVLSQLDNAGPMGVLYKRSAR